MDTTVGDLTQCPNCRSEVPGAQFCVCCGEPLENATSPYPLEGRGFAAAPNEHRARPSIVSSLFPHLPRADMLAFRVTLALGTTAIVSLALFALFPLALVVAAVLVPGLTVLYLIQVDLYEDDPWPVLGLTVGWGLLTGLGIGLLSRAIVRHHTTLAVDGDGDAVIWLGIVLPLASAGLIMLGPLILFTYRRFNDVLDGASFGASCGVTFAGAVILTNSSDLLRSGVRVTGSTTPWALRLLTLGIVKPVLVAAAMGIAMSTLWLQFRAPVRDRPKLGFVGLPVFAVPAATLVVVGIALAELYLNRWVTLAVLAAAAALALVGLRHVIHIGLVDELSELEIGPPFVCPNCGRETPLHTFCAACGTALQALPKRPDRPVDDRRHGEARSFARVPQPPRLDPRVLLPLFVAATLLVVSVASIVIESWVAPAAARAPCEPDQPCSTPPRATPPLARPSSSNLRGAGPEGRRPWTSRSGASLRFDRRVWEVLLEERDELELFRVTDGERLWVTVRAVPNGEMLPAQLLQDQVARDARHYLIDVDSTPSHQLLGPSIGSVDGDGSAYAGVRDLPPSPSVPVQLLLESATNGVATVLVRVMTDSPAQTPEAGASPFPIFSLADGLLARFDWPQRSP